MIRKHLQYLTFLVRANIFHKFYYFNHALFTVHASWNINIVLKIPKICFLLNRNLLNRNLHIVLIADCRCSSKRYIGWPLDLKSLDLQSLALILHHMSNNHRLFEIGNVTQNILVTITITIFSVCYFWEAVANRSYCITTDNDLNISPLSV